MLVVVNHMGDTITAVRTMRMCHASSHILLAVSSMFLKLQHQEIEFAHKRQCNVIV